MEFEAEFAGTGFPRGFRGAAAALRGAIAFGAAFAKGGLGLVARGTIGDVPEEIGAIDFRGGGPEVEELAEAMGGGIWSIVGAEDVTLLGGGGGGAVVAAAFALAIGFGMELAGGGEAAGAPAKSFLRSAKLIGPAASVAMLVLLTSTVSWQ